MEVGAAFEELLELLPQDVESFSWPLSTVELEVEAYGFKVSWRVNFLCKLLDEAVGGFAGEEVDDRGGCSPFSVRAKELFDAMNDEEEALEDEVKLF